MKIIEENFTGAAPDILFSMSGQTGRPLFLDIETTGLTPARASVYLIGCAYPDPAADKEAVPGSPGSCCYTLRQFFAEKPSSEREILSSFLEFQKDFDVFVHYNGERFDMKFLRERMSALGMTGALYEDFTCKPGIDIYKLIKPWKKALGLQDLKQKTLERFLGTGRTDDTSGGELISVYLEEAVRPTAAGTAMLLLHNADDVRGMPKLSAVFDDISVLSGIISASLAHDGELPVTPCGVTVSENRSLHGNTVTDVLIDFSLASPLSRPISIHSEGFFLKLRGGSGRLRVPGLSGSLKYFFPDPRNYYYLPADDMVVHKSVGTFVDRSHREKATPEKCYAAAEGVFVPVPVKGKKCDPSPAMSGVRLFREDYASRERFMRVEEKKDMDRYLVHVLAYLFH